MGDEGTKSALRGYLAGLKRYFLGDA